MRRPSGEAIRRPSGGHQEVIRRPSGGHQAAVERSSEGSSSKRSAKRLPGVELWARVRLGVYAVESEHRVQIRRTPVGAHHVARAEAARVSTAADALPVELSGGRSHEIRMRPDEIEGDQTRSGALNEIR